jgi:hypothetical protein
MSTDHRKPAVAFVALAFAAAGLVGVQQADAQGGRFMAGIVGSDAQVRGEIAAQSRARSPQQTALGQAFVAFSRPAAQSVEPSRTVDLSGQVSRTQDRPPVSETPVQREPVAESSTDSTGRGGTSRDEQPSRRAREGRREPAQRGADRRSNRAAEHAAAREKAGSRRGRAGDERP